jgi:hypothetical protein
VFDTKICKEIFSECLRRNQKSLTECVEETCKPLLQNQANNWPFSEFELYGSYCFEHKLDSVVVDKKNWNYAPGQAGINLPIQIMWQNYEPDVVEKLLER